MGGFTKPFFRRLRRLWEVISDRLEVAVRASRIPLDTYSVPSRRESITSQSAERRAWFCSCPAIAPGVPGVSWIIEGPGELDRGNAIFGQRSPRLGIGGLLSKREDGPSELSHAVVSGSGYARVSRSHRSFHCARMNSTRCFARRWWSISDRATSPVGQARFYQLTERLEQGTKNPPSQRSSGFDSRLRHHLFSSPHDEYHVRAVTLDPPLTRGGQQGCR